MPTPAKNLALAPACAAQADWFSSAWSRTRASGRAFGVHGGGGSKWSGSQSFWFRGSGFGALRLQGSFLGFKVAGICSFRVPYVNRTPQNPQGKQFTRTTSINHPKHLTLTLSPKPQALRRGTLHTLNPVRPPSSLQHGSPSTQS